MEIFPSYIDKLKIMWYYGINSEDIIKIRRQDKALGFFFKRSVKEGNEKMETTGFIIKNKAIPQNAEKIVERLTESGETVQFVIVGDLELSGRYAETALIFTDVAVVSYNGTEGDERRYEYKDMKEVESKRMYGNATLSALMPNGKREVFFRYTYSVASLCDAAALFINHTNDGADKNEELAIMAVTFERALSVCPK